MGEALGEIHRREGFGQRLEFRAQGFNVVGLECRRRQFCGGSVGELGKRFELGSRLLEVVGGQRLLDLDILGQLGTEIDGLGFDRGCDGGRCHGRTPTDHHQEDDAEEDHRACVHCVTLTTADGLPDGSAGAPADVRTTSQKSIQRAKYGNNETDER